MDNGMSGNPDPLFMRDAVLQTAQECEICTGILVAQ